MLGVAMIAGRKRLAFRLTAREIYALRALYEDKPSAAKDLVLTLRVLFAFGIPRGYIDRNPAADVAPLPRVGVDVKHARPWPEDAFKRVLQEAPEHVRRAAFLARGAVVVSA
jgi:hypothetical protein